MIIYMLCVEGANFLKNFLVKVKISSGKGFKKLAPQVFGGGGARAPRAPPPAYALDEDGIKLKTTIQSCQ